MNRAPTKAALSRAAAGASSEALARAMRLLLAADDNTSPKVDSPEDVARIALEHLGGLEHEALVVIAFDRLHRAIDTAVLTVGSSGFTIVDPPQIMRWVLTRKRPASAFALAHNHPSGDVTPSQQDREVTLRVARAAATVGLRFLDHVVVVDSGKHASLAAEGVCGDFKRPTSWTGP